MGNLLIYSAAENFLHLPEVMLQGLRIVASNCPSLHHRERGSPMKNRKREICTSGSVRDEDGQPPHLLGRRTFLHLAAGATALPLLSRIARAQAYPTRPVRLIAPFTTCVLHMPRLRV